MTNDFYNDFDRTELEPSTPDYRSPFQRGRDRLVRPFSSGAKRKGIAHNRLSHAGRTIGAIGRIGNEDPEYRDMVHGLTPLAGSRPCGT